MQYRPVHRLYTVLALAFIAIYPSPAVSDDANRPNVILIMTDDQGYGDMSCHGNPYIKTPNIDRLHDQSVRLANFHVDPTCSPTRGALMTGRYSTRVGVWLTYMGRHHLRANELTLGDAFSRSGYRTAIFGKWHLGDNWPFRPNDRGFDESLIHGGGVAGESPDYWGNDYHDDTYFRNNVPEKTTGYCTDVWFDEAIRFIDSSRDRPFFCYIPTNAPHGPMNVPWKYVEPYTDNPDIPASRARFYGLIASIDENLGRLRTHLETTGLDKNTLLIFLNDNGTSSGVTLKGKHGFPVGGFNAGMRGKKGSAYEGGHRAACFLYWPQGGLADARDVTPIAAQIDLVPTLIDLCGLKPTDVVYDGRSLVPLLRPGSRDARWPDRTLFVHHQGRFGQDVLDDRPIKYKDFAVMTDRWRLVGEELYDMAADPGQRTDVAAEHPAVVSQLSDAYETWWTDITADMDEYARTIIGSAKQDRTKLTCQSWHGKTVPYNQEHVRNAMSSNGFWDLEVATQGVYEVTLRRWPEELDAAMDALVEQQELDPNKVDVDSRLYQLPSKAIHAKQARLKVGNFDKTVAVTSGDKEITFAVSLAVGPVDLQTWLTDAEGGSWGAYYVYVQKKN